MIPLLAALLVSSVLTACTPTALDPAASEVALEKAFPAHPRWRRPLWFGALVPGERWHAVVEQAGRIHVFALEPDGTAGAPGEFLDLTEQVTSRGNEQGLLGLAFHPHFRENRRFFLYYSVEGRDRTRLSEWKAAPGEPPSADPGSERVLLEIEQPWENHNGGELVFGPDGRLYLGVGDGGAAGDPREAAQDLATLLGKILRIDVDGDEAGRAYAIPADNPFAGEPGARGEIWALGLRNPWRFSFDPEGGALWCGDVGQDAWEEVDVVVRGGNYGWPRREGFVAFREQGKRGPGALADPVLAYSRREGQSITGGFVYRGERVPALRGRYVFADYQSGRVWSVPASGAPRPEKRSIGRVDSVASFGVDAWGELYLVSFDGPIRKLVYGVR